MTDISVVSDAQASRLATYLSAGVVMSPQRSNLILSSHVLVSVHVYFQVSGAEIPTQTLNLTFLYVTVSTLKPTVGMVVTDWLSLSL